jgi:hypothetical protein
VFATRFVPPSVSAPPAGVRAAAEWAGFAVALMVFVESFAGHMRALGPALLAVALGLSAGALGWPRRRVLARAGWVAVALAGALVLRQTADRPVGAWAGRGLLLAGTGFAALGWTPTALRFRLRDLLDAMTAAPDGPLAKRFALVAVAAPAVVLFLTDHCNRFSGDTMPVMATVARMWQAGDRDLSPYTAEPRAGRWTQFVNQNPPYNMHPSAHRPGLYSAYPAGMEVFAWPAAMAAVLAGADLSDDGAQARAEYRAAAVLAALSLALFFLTALHVADAAAAYAVTAMLATGSVFFTTYSHLFWQQSGVVFWALVVLLTEFRTAGRPGRRGVLVQGVACGLMLGCRSSAATFLVPFGLWVLARDWRRGLLVPAVAAAAYAPFAAVYWGLHRSLLGPSHILFAGLREPTWEAFAGVLVSPARGLLVYQPMLVLLPVAAVAGWRAGVGRAGYWLFAAGFAGLHLLLGASWFMWWGGHCHGSRLVGEVVPVLALGLAPAVGRLLRAWGGRAVVGAVLALGAMTHHNTATYGTIRWNVVPTDVDADPARLWDWTRPPFLYLPQAMIGGAGGRG